VLIHSIVWQRNTGHCATQYLPDFSGTKRSQRQQLQAAMEVPVAVKNYRSSSLHPRKLIRDQCIDLILAHIPLDSL
jgi:hypothetical protein